MTDLVKPVFMKDAYIAQSDDFRYCFPAVNFMQVSKWDMIATDGWNPVYAPHDMTLVMPKKQEIIRAWIEAFFIWDTH